MTIQPFVREIYYYVLKPLKLPVHNKIHLNNMPGPRQEKTFFGVLRTTHGWFESHFVGNPKVRFCCGKAHMCTQPLLIPTSATIIFSILSWKQYYIFFISIVEYLDLLWMPRVI